MLKEFSQTAKTGMYFDIYTALGGGVADFTIKVQFQLVQGLAQETVYEITKGGLIHDIGKGFGAFTFR